MKIRRFGKIYMHKILIDRFYEFQKSTQKWKSLTFLAIFTHYEAFNGIIFIFLIYSRPLWARWCIFQKNPIQNFFDQNHCISPIYGSWSMTPEIHQTTHDSYRLMELNNYNVVIELYDIVYIDILNNELLLLLLPLFPLRIIWLFRDSSVIQTSSPPVDTNWKLSFFRSTSSKDKHFSNLRKPASIVAIIFPFWNISMAEPEKAFLLREQSLRCLLDLALIQKSKHESRDCSEIVKKYLSLRINAILYFLHNSPRDHRDKEYCTMI